MRAKVNSARGKVNETVDERPKISAAVTVSTRAAIALGLTATDVLAFICVHRAIGVHSKSPQFVLDKRFRD